MLAKGGRVKRDFKRPEVMAARAGTPFEDPQELPLLSRGRLDRPPGWVGLLESFGKRNSGRIGCQELT